MSLERPAYRATLTNHSRGWVQTVTAGDQPDPEATVQLLDELTTSWDARDSLPFMQLDPSAFTFRIAGRTVADLLDMDYDDELTLRLERPTALGDYLELAEVSGAVSDLALATSVGNLLANGRRVAVLTVSVVDPSASLESTTVTLNELRDGADIGFSGLEAGTFRALRLAGIPAAREADTSDDWTMPYIVAEDTPVREITDQMHNGIRENNGETLAVLRTVRGWDSDPDYVFEGDGPHRYYTDYWTLGPADTTPLFQLTVVAGQVQLTRLDADTQDGITVVPACLLAGEQSWRRSRRRGIDSLVQLTAYSLDDPATDLPAKVMTAATGPQTKASPRTTVELTTAMDWGWDEFYGRNWQATALRRHVEARRPSPAWSLPDVSLDTSLMTDEQWDYYADRVFAPSRPGRGFFGRPIVLVDVAEEVNPAGYSSTYVVAGTTLTLRRGQVLAQLTLAARPLRVSSSSVAVTIDQADAHPAFGNLTAGTLDRRLTYDDLKLTRL